MRYCPKVVTPVRTRTGVLKTATLYNRAAHVAVDGSLLFFSFSDHFNRKNRINRENCPISVSNPGTKYSTPLSRTMAETFLLCAVRPRFFCAGRIRRRVSINLLIFSCCYGIIHSERTVCRKEAMRWRIIQKNNGMPGKSN